MASPETAFSSRGPGPERRRLAWRLNWYRQSELDGAVLLGQTIEQASDGYLISRLTQHCADEARHAVLWERLIVRLDLPLVRILRSYQSLCIEEAGRPVGIVEALAFTHVIEQRIQQHFADELQRPGLPHAVHRVVTAVLRSEQAHLDWLGRWLAAQPAADRPIAQYRDVDARVHRRLVRFGDRMWDIAGLGEELHDSESS